MTAKIVRVLLVFTTILILGFYLPDLFRSRFEKRAGKRLLYYSEVKRDFDINPYSYAMNSSRTLDPDEFTRATTLPSTFSTNLGRTTSISTSWIRSSKRSCVTNPSRVSNCAHWPPSNIRLRRRSTTLRLFESGPRLPCNG